jgi:anti-sigma-K factor RskA
MSGHDPHEERMRDDLAAYALGSLPADAVAELERHLESCDLCAARLRWLRPAVDLLPASVEQLTPPPELRDRLLAEVRAEAERSASLASPAGARRRRWRWWPEPGAILRPATAIAAALLVAVGGGVGYLLGDRTEEPETTVVEARPLAEGVEVSATLERTSAGVILHVDELPELERGEVYEVWIQRAGALEPSTLFVVDPEGTGTAAVPGPLEGAEAVLVTREPRRGSEQPTTPPLLEAPLR